MEDKEKYSKSLLRKVADTISKEAFGKDDMSYSDIAAESAKKTVDFTKSTTKKVKDRYNKNDKEILRTVQAGIDQGVDFIHDSWKKYYNKKQNDNVKKSEIIDAEVKINSDKDK